jgi:TPR repeat protein
MYYLKDREANLRDRKKAAVWLAKAVKLGHLQAQFNLGCIYRGTRIP